jgi:hypothetical protein
MAEKYAGKITILEELVSTDTSSTRRFTFQPLDRLECMWQVMLGDKGLLICNHKPGNLHKLLIAKPNFIELNQEFETLKVLLAANGVNATEPVLCWLRGLIHALVAETQNVIA